MKYLSKLLPYTKINVLFMYSLIGFLLFISFIVKAQTKPNIPKNQIPPSVLVELRHLEHKFEQALSQDCAQERCFPKGCTYGQHVIVDQPSTLSLPGLGQDVGPGGVPVQEYLTVAHCSFAYEQSIRTRDAQTLVKRLQAKLSKGWTIVEVTSERLQPIPSILRESPKKPEPIPKEIPEPKEEEPVPEIKTEPEEWKATVALRELWQNLLPHFSWMIALVMLTFSILIIIWGLRRLGRQSEEDKALMAQMLQSPEKSEDTKSSEENLDEEVSEDDQIQNTEEITTDTNQNNNFVSEQITAWSERLNSIKQTKDDFGLKDLISELLRTKELNLLAKAVLHFPNEFPKAFPDEGEFASIKLELADFLKNVNANELPSDEEFFEKLNRHLLSSSLASQTDAKIVRSLKEEFGTAGIAQLAGSLSARHGALLFALAPFENQYEIARLLTQNQIQKAVEQLLLSNRMDPQETTYLFDVLTAVRTNEPIPSTSKINTISDRGPEFNATSALSILLHNMTKESRTLVFNNAINSFNGSFPFWYKGILFPDMLLKLSTEMRANLFLEVNIDGLAGWLSMQDIQSKEQLLDNLPNSLRAAIEAASIFTSRSQQIAFARTGRKNLAEAIQIQIARSNVPFEQLIL